MLSELGAVNTMLSALGVSPVNSITGQVSSDVAACRSILEEVRSDVMLQGWDFNTAKSVPLTPGADKRIRLPQATLRMDMSDGETANVDPVQRGDYLFDRRNQTYTFTQGFKVDVITDLKWEDTPQVARAYIAKRAARVFVQRMDGDEKRIRTAQMDEMSALATLQQNELDTGDYTIFDNQTAHLILHRGL